MIHRYFANETLFYPWQFVLLVGASLVLSAILIFLLPELLAYLVATVLLWIGILFLGIAFKVKKMESYRF